MLTRRHFMDSIAIGAAAAAFSSILPTSSHAAAGGAVPSRATGPATAPVPKFKLEHQLGLGGVAIGNGFKPTSDEDAQATLEAAWEKGIRYFDTSPWYGLGLSERRFGHFLHNKKPEEYVLSTKVGRLLKPGAAPTDKLWKGNLVSTYEYDYSAAGVRRSVEDSLQRLGVSQIDVVFIHDLSPDNEDMKEKWTEYFDVAVKGAMPELIRMRDEGIIKGWGLGVNRIEPILRTLKESDPDLFLAATQYSIIDHQDAVDRLFPACDAKGVSIVVGSPLNAGFLAGVERFNYGKTIPADMLKKREQVKVIAAKHKVDLRTAAIQFSLAPATVSAILTGARTGEQITQNVASLKEKIPAAFWTELQQQKLISDKAALPA